VRSGRATAPLRVLQVESTFLSAILLVENNAPPVRHVAQEQSRSFGQTAKPEQTPTAKQTPCVYDWHTDDAVIVLRYCWRCQDESSGGGAWLEAEGSAAGSLLLVRALQQP
jgi:hypothetical protein